uniref:cell division protein n=1 Tax=Coelastrum microporum TaxID=55409 RepID=UPI00226CF4C9|nr:cell division protein [Coelastrum microporum]UWM13051.1 cell division protein [Coelastrum microporum]
MKQKKYFMKKFHKKYVFLQNSLFDFLYWRSLKSEEPKIQIQQSRNFTNQSSNLQFEGSEKNSKFSLLEQEKISFHEYWQSSNSQKIKNEIENINKEFPFFTLAGRSETSSLNLFHNNEKKKFSVSILNKKVPFGLLRWQKRENFQGFEQKVLYSGAEPRIKKRFLKSWKNEKRFFVQNKKTQRQKKSQFKIYLSSFSKRFESSQNPLLCSLTTETFIPKSDCFEKLDKLKFLQNFKIGPFFPKRQNFQQYWIFPLLGFILFFSSNAFRKSSISSFQKNASPHILTFTETQTSQKKNFSHFSFFPTFECFQKQETFDFSGNQLNSENTMGGLTDCSFQKLRVPQKSPFQFSYFSQKLSENVFSFQKMETFEFEMLTKLYFQKFNHLFVSFLIDEKQNQFLLESLFEKNFENNFFYKKMQAKRNIFNWQWFHAQTTPFFSYEIDTKTFENSILRGECHSEKIVKKQYESNFSNPFQLKIPQKAQFFEPRSFEERFFSFDLSLNDRKKFQLTPLFHFLKTARFFNEFEKNLFFQKNVFQKSENFSAKNHPFFSFFSHLKQLRYTSTDKEIQEFVNTLKKENFRDFQFLQFKNMRNVSSNPFLFSKGESSKFLQKWLQTQNLCTIAKTYTTQKVQKNTNFFQKQKKQNVTVSSFSEMVQKKDLFGFQPSTKNQEFVLKKSRTVFNFDQQKKILTFFQGSLQRLDFIYFHKMLKQLSSWNIQTKKSKIQAFETKNVQIQKKNESFIDSHEPLKKKLLLKKKFFEFSVLTYCKTNSEKYLKDSMNQKSFEQEKPKIENQFQNTSQQLGNDLYNSSTSILNQLPLFLDFGNISLFSRNFIFQKQFENIQNKMYQPLFLKDALFQNLVFNFPNSHFFFNNVQFFGSHHSSYYFQISQKFWNFFTKSQQKKENDSLNVCFFKSKLNSFEKFLKNANAQYVFHVSSLNFFKTTFFFEKLKKPQALTVQIENDSVNFPLFSHKFWFFANTGGNEKNFSFLDNSKPFKMQFPTFEKILKKSSKSIFLQKKYSDFSTNKHQNSHFERNFHLRKFEKIFQMSLSPLNKNKENRKKPTNFPLKETQINQFSSFEKTKTFFKGKSNKDGIILKNFGKSFQNGYDLSKSSTQLFSTHTHLSKKADRDSAFSSRKGFPFKKKQNALEKKNLVQKNSFSTKTLQFLSPNLIVKRDGFVFFPFLKEKIQNQSSFQIFDYDFFSNTKMKKQYSQPSGQQKQKSLLWNTHFSRFKNQKSISISNYSEVFEKQDKVFFQRFEKEKFFQKKRRLKKQKLETRRRKKRKRFFPRPVWLRFHLYKKFLNIRHPLKLQKEEVPMEKNEKKIENVRFSFEKNTTVSKSSRFFLKNTYFHFPLFFRPQINHVFGTSENIEKNSFFSLKRKNKKVSFRRFSAFDQKNFHKSFQNDVFCQFPSTVFKRKKDSESFINRLYQKNNQKWGFYKQNLYQKKTILQKFGTHSFLGNYQNQIVTNGPYSGSMSKNIEHYKISGEILREFIRLSWKSYWFQTNFRPYTQQLTQNFQNMKKIEGHKSFAEYNLFECFRNFQFPLLLTNVSNVRNDGFSDNFRKCSSLANLQFFQNILFRNSHSQNDFLYRKSLVQKFVSYSNIQNSLPSNFSQNNLSLFFNLQNIAEYNRILYSRVSEILKNGKALENNEELFGKKTGIFQPKRKNENMAVSNTNGSFFTKTALFSENFCVPSQPTIPAFSLFSSLFQDSSIKPTGELPTLRALWAFRQTNFSQFQETNTLRNVWTLKKRTESLKNLKGTKQFLNFVRKLRGPDKTNVFGKTNKNSLFSTNQPKALDPFFVSNPKNDFHEFGNQLDNISWKKFQNVEKKSSLFGIQSLKQNSKLSLRYLKFHLLLKHEFSISDGFQKNEQSYGEKTNSIAVLPQNPQNQIQKPNSMNSAKSSLNYWWSQKNFTIFPFLFSPENSSSNFLDFGFRTQNTVPQFFTAENDHIKQTQNVFSLEKQEINQMQLVYFGALLFHFAIFLTISKIPEIRSVLKFQCLVFYKILNGFSVVLFSIYHFLRKYSENIYHLIEFYFSFSKKRNGQIPLQSFSAFPFASLNRKRQTSLSSIENNLVVPSWNSKHGFILNKNKNFLFEFFLRVSNFSLLKTSENTCEFSFRVAPFSENKKLENLSFEENSRKIVIKNKLNFSKQKNKQFQKFFSSLPKNYSPQLKMDFLKQYVIQYRFQQINSQIPVFKFRSILNFLNISGKFGNKKDFQLRNYQKKTNFNVFSKQTFVFGKEQNILSAKEFFLVEPSFMKSKNFHISESSFFNDQGNAFKKNISRQHISKKSKFHGNFRGKIPSNTEKWSSELAFSFLILGKSLTVVSLNTLKISSSLSGILLNGFEFILFNIYKFLEKPAELMIEWIALIFLIEWSSDVITFIPDTFDISVAKTSQKFLRPFRGGSLALNMLNSSGTMSFSAFHPFSFGSVFYVANSISVFTYSNMFSFILHKRLSYFFENFAYQLMQPDVDILVRQRKGMIFWDIWAEILLKAAEKYNVNIPSFVTLKEEQEVFIEKLLQDGQFLKNVRSSKTISNVSSFNFFGKKDQTFFNFETVQQNSLMSFIENFLIKERPSTLSNVENSFQLVQKNIREEIISNSIFSLSLNEWFSLSVQNRNSFSESSTKVKFDNMLKKQFFSTYCQIPLFSNEKNLSLSSGNFYDRWACNQNGIYQSPETDLFVDMHPAKSLQHIHYLKYYEPAQYTLGSLICQVYSGLFSKQVSKNILLIGSPGTAKTLFIQALAGETEMKMITDNAYRYSTVQRGVAVGMKYLRDVFDAIALQTPCFFLMEHIHVIGSKRPLLISDDENVKASQASFGLDQQEVHETNQMIYQSSKHSISDFKRPYKGDFSMGIPTNFFVQNFYSHIEKNSSSLFQNSQFAFGGTYAISRTSPNSPLPIDSIENSLFQQNVAQKDNSDTKFQNTFLQNRSFKSQSFLQIAKEQIFAPPATSPFTVLMMKEQKKLKPKKIVQENSWGGVSADQLVSYQKESHSVRAKVALLADITMNLSRGKLDMITDLLVIIDSVRSNRGFVVFATTHVPSSLDPALRRPGRFDESISLAQNTNLFNRFEIFKTYFSNSISTLDFLDSSIITENFSEIDLFNLITGTKLSFFRQYTFQNNLNSSLQTRLFSYVSPHKALQSFLKSSFFQNFYQKHHIFQKGAVEKEPPMLQNLDKSLPSFSQNFSKKDFQQTQKQDQAFSFASWTPSLGSDQNNVQQHSFFSLRKNQFTKFPVLPKGPSHLLTNAYSKIGPLIIQLNLMKDPMSCAPVRLNQTKQSDPRSFLGTSLYDSEKNQKFQLMLFLSGKVAEFCGNPAHQVFSLSEPTSSKKSISSEYFILNSFEKTKDLNKGIQKDFVQNKQNLRFENSFELFDRKFSIFPFIVSNHSKTAETNQNSFSVNSANLMEFQKIKIFNSVSPQICQSSFLKNSYFWSAFGNDESWRLATPFLYSMIQKRFLFTKNLLLSKMLFFENRNSLKQPPSPPNSSILMPSKKYENFKRTENDFLTKASFSINEKIQFHQQQRFLKQLYNVSVQQYFRSEIVPKRQTFFGNAFQEIAYLDAVTSRSSSVHFYQKKYLGLRHRFSNINQWWNGMLPEHTTETTYLSDVDWRTMFVSKKTHSRVLKSTESGFNENVHSKLSLNHQTLEFTMDFPDAEQYYNPRNRRWYLNSHFLNSDSCNILHKNSYLLSLNTDLQYEIYYHYLMQSFNETYQYFDKNREMLDFFVFCLLKTGFLKEFDYLTILSRFQKVFM